MAYFPFMIDITDKNCLVVGGGTIAFHKVKILSEYDVRIHVVSSEICKELYEFEAAYETVEIHKRSFQDSDIERQDFVIAATDDRDLNNYISHLCKEHNILVNVVDTKEACSFIFPALLKREDLLVSVSTGGKSPAGAAYVKKKIDSSIPEFYGKMMTNLGDYREYILKNVNEEDRKEVFNRLLQYGSEHNGEIPAKIVEQYLNGE